MSVIKILFALITVFYASALFASPPQNSFAISEHITMGNQIKLRFSDAEPGEKGVFLHLPNSLAATYGDIMGLGDLYGIPEQPVSKATTSKERTARFKANFNSLARVYTSAYEAAQLIDVGHEELNAVKKGMEQGEKPEVVFHRISNEIGRKLNCITGGGCSPTTWWLEPGRYLKLANENYDHFQDNAWLSYTVGHRAALEKAMTAHKTNDRKALEMAYAINAFACHFLSDRFSAGHLRTPRDELSAQVTPLTVGSLLAKYMHNEENAAGLHVHNSRGDKWIAYGDDSYFNPDNKLNSQLLAEALQLSADSIFQAYQQGVLPEADPIEQLIPWADENRDVNRDDISPLFYWDPRSQKLMRRQDMKNYYDRHWISNWWGWSTLTELIRERGLDAPGKGQLAMSSVKQRAVEEGLITLPNKNR